MVWRHATAPILEPVVVSPELVLHESFAECGCEAALVGPAAERCRRSSRSTRERAEWLLHSSGNPPRDALPSRTFLYPPADQVSRVRTDRYRSRNSRQLSCYRRA